MGSESVQFCQPFGGGNHTSNFPFPLPDLDPNFTFPSLNFTGDFPPMDLPMNITIEKVPEEDMYMDIKHTAYNVVLPIIFIFGIVGNTLNIIIFSKSRFRHSLDEVEKSATTGLVALAVSDLLFCLVGVPAAFVSSVTCESCSTAGKVVLFYYQTYKGPLLNVFLFSSTWLTVAISIERYLAVCYPLHVRYLVRVKRTILIDVSIYLVSVVFNIPEFLKWKFLYSSCPNGSLYIAYLPSDFYFKQAFKQTYRAVWATFGAFIPLVILSYCNIRLILEVSRSKARYSADRGKYTTSRITIILIAIIVLHIVLVCPTLVLSFLVDFVAFKLSRILYFRYLTAVVISNVLQTINFAINFILYCVISKTFRENLRSRTCKIQNTQKTTPRTSSEEQKHKYQLVDMTTNPTVSTRATPTTSRANGNCLT